eukprot:5096166-Prymnesium_polylepis.1
MSGTHPIAITSYTRVLKPMPPGAKQNLEVRMTSRYSSLRSPDGSSPRRSRRRNPGVVLCALKRACRAPME